MIPRATHLRVLVTDSDTRAALAATRSLARSGHEVITAGERCTSLSSVSRYSSGFVSYPSPMSEPNGFIVAMDTAINKFAIDVVLPMTEVTTLLLTEHRDRTGLPCALPFSSFSSISRASDKAEMVELARDLGVPAPKTIVVRTPEEARATIPNLEFPIVIKPARSRVRTADGWRSACVSYAAGSGDLESRLRQLHPAVFPVLLQEKIIGSGVGLFACYNRGQPIAYFSHRRLREKPPSGGVSVLSESTPLNPVAVDYATRMLDRLSWHGVAMVEFKRDDRDGQLRLMEINSRFWGSLNLAIKSGVDFPSIAVRLAGGMEQPPLPPYRIGVRNRWLLGDLDALLSVLLHRRGGMNLPPGFPPRLRLAWDFMHLWGRDLHYEIWSLSDPRPGMLEIGRWLRGSQF